MDGSRYDWRNDTRHPGTTPPPQNTKREIAITILVAIAWLGVIVALDASGLQTLVAPSISITGE